MEQTAKHRQTLKVLLVAVLVGAAVYWFTMQSVKTFETAVITQLDATQSELASIANTTGLAQIDEATSQVIRDCSSRTEYESLLQNLESLSRADLLRVQDLHGDCGEYFPTVRSFMAHRLEATLGHLESTLALQDALGENLDEEYKVDAWRSLIAKELARAELLHQQNTVQGQIIDAFVDNRRAEVPDLLQEAQSINGSLNVTSIQINTERDALLGT